MVNSSTTSHVLHSVLRWLVPIGSCLLLGPLAGWLTHTLRAPDGGAHTSLLLSASPLLGLLAGAGAVLLAGIAGVFAAAIIGTRMGLFTAGLVLAWASFGTGRIDGILGRVAAGGRGGGAGAMTLLSVEGLVVGLLGVLIAAAVLLVPVRRAASQADAQHHPVQHFAEPRKILHRSAPLAMFAGVVGAGLVVWLVAQSTAKGQTFAAAALGGVVAGAALRILAVHASGVWAFVAFAILSTASPVLARFMSDDVAAAALSGQLLRLAHPLPLDYLAGALVGVPMGLAWGASMVVKAETAAK